jgi:hypothetical protein
MRERRRIQAARVRSDREILPLLGHLWQPQFAGTAYADAARQLFSRLDLYDLARPAMPTRVLVLAPGDSMEAEKVAAQLGQGEDAPLVALVYLSGDGAGKEGTNVNGHTRHYLTVEEPALQGLLGHADAVVALGGTDDSRALGLTDKPLAVVGGPGNGNDGRAREIRIDDIEVLRAFCLDPQVGKRE